MRAGQTEDFRYYGALSGVYDDGLTPVSVNQSGQIPHLPADYGVEASFGAFGSKMWRHDTLKLDYHGAYRHYQRNHYFDGSDHILTLDYKHLLSRRMTLRLSDSLGTISRSNGEFTFVPLTNSDQFAVPANELFDNRAYFIQSKNMLVFQKSARLSFSAGGEGFAVRRQSAALVGMTGARGRGDVAYRFKRNQSIFATYSYAYYVYQRAFGDSAINTAALGYSIRFARHWDLSFQGGVDRVRVLGLRQVAIDPAVAAIIGRPFAIAVFRAVDYVPNAEGRLTRSWARSALTLDGTSGIVPGNGVFLTSRQTAASISYSYSAIKRTTLGVHSGYSSLSSVGQGIGKYDNYQSGAGFTYRLFEGAHFEARYDFRHYTTQNQLFKKQSNRVTIGIAFSPTSVPLPIW